MCMPDHYRIVSTCRQFHRSIACNKLHQIAQSLSVLLNVYMHLMQFVQHLHAFVLHLLQPQGADSLVRDCSGLIAMVKPLSSQHLSTPDPNGALPNIVAD